MATYTVTISSADDLLTTWTDSSVPHMSFGYNEIELDECIDNGDGTYTASYNSLEMSASKKIKYIHPVNGETIYTLGAGEYGIKP